MPTSENVGSPMSGNDCLCGLLRAGQAVERVASRYRGVCGGLAEADRSEGKDLHDALARGPVVVPDAARAVPGPRLPGVCSGVGDHVAKALLNESPIMAPIICIMQGERPIASDLPVIPDHGLMRRQRRRTTELREM